MKIWVFVYLFFFSNFTFPYNVNDGVSTDRTSGPSIQSRPGKFEKEVRCRGAIKAASVASRKNFCFEFSISKDPKYYNQVFELDDSFIRVYQLNSKTVKNRMPDSSETHNIKHSSSSTSDGREVATRFTKKGQNFTKCARKNKITKADQSEMSDVVVRRELPDPELFAKIFRDSLSRVQERDKFIEPYLDPYVSKKRKGQNLSAEQIEEEKDHKRQLLLASTLGVFCDCKDISGLEETLQTMFSNYRGQINELPGSDPHKITLIEFLEDARSCLPSAGESFNF